MSARTDNSAWSPDEADSLENIDKEIQLVSLSTESHAMSNQADENGSMGKEKIKSDPSSRAEFASRQSTFSIFHSKSYDNLQAIKFHTSSSDKTGQESKFRFHDNKNAVNCSDIPNDTLKNQFAEKAYFYENAKGKIIQGCKNNTVQQKALIMKSTESSDKEDYLELVNKQLTKELDEKNAILSLLQENYECLLFKYAEAQNRIDELRIKFLAEKSEPKNFQMKQDFTNNHISYFCNEYSGKPGDIKCQKAVATAFVDLNEPSDLNMAPTISRPSSLPLDNSLKFGERDLLKATTPTDSEGLSSIITSMSGHSKILNSLDEENQINKKSNIFKYKRNNFLLKENIVLNDPFDKVKNWQNSLPPLEQIETPETTLYNVNNAFSSTGTNYKEISSPKMEKEYIFSDESCPQSWKEEVRSYNERCDMKRGQMPSQSASSNRFYAKKSSDEREQFHEGNFEVNEKTKVPATSIIQRRHKRPPLLRCSSLPAYDYESIKSGNFKNGIYIPPLDLNNVTLSDDESYCQHEYYLSKSNGATSSSLISSDDPIDRSIQTPQSFSSCKATISEERVPRLTISKSTSITPDRSRAMDLSFANCERKFEAASSKTSPYLKKGNECCNDKSVNRCNICGEYIAGDKSNRSFGSKSNSCESVHKKGIFTKEPPTRRVKPPFKRSVSFGSCTGSTRNCSHEKQMPRDYFSGLNQDSVENFDAYASNLKARSQVVIKALAAHVNNS